MILHKAPKEQKSFLTDKPTLANTLFFVLARQAIYNYLLKCKEEFVLVPRYLAGGVCFPIIKSGKKRIYYDLNDKLEIESSSLQLNQYSKENLIIYYIHHYGLFIKSNIDYLQKLSKQGYHIIDDRSLSLPSKNYVEFADATVYSLYKLTGVPYGAFINSRDNLYIDDSINKNCIYDIEMIMERNLKFYGAFFIKYLSGFWFRLINKLYGNSVNFNPIVENSWHANNFIAKLQVLKYLDFEKINSKRIKLAQIYLENLTKDCIFAFDTLSYLNQSLIGFPIFTNTPELLHKHLIKNGVHTFILKRSWWFDTEEKQWEIVNNHILLPIHHYLEEKDILKVCEIINKRIK